MAGQICQNCYLLNSANSVRCSRCGELLPKNVPEIEKSNEEIDQKSSYFKPSMPRAEPKHTRPKQNLCPHCDKEFSVGEFTCPSCGGYLPLKSMSDKSGVIETAKKQKYLERKPTYNPITPEKYVERANMAANLAAIYGLIAFWVAIQQMSYGGTGILFGVLNIVLGLSIFPYSVSVRKRKPEAYDTGIRWSKGGLAWMALQSVLCAPLSGEATGLSYLSIGLWAACHAMFWIVLSSAEPAFQEIKEKTVTTTAIIEEPVLSEKNSKDSGISPQPKYITGIDKAIPRMVKCPDCGTDVPHAKTLVKCPNCSLGFLPPLE